MKELDPESLDVMVPAMLLQPLVENSIKHGLPRRSKVAAFTCVAACRIRGL